MKKLVIVAAVLSLGILASCAVAGSAGLQPQITQDMVIEAMSYHPAAPGGMIVFWETNTGEFIKSYDMDAYIVDNGGLWDVYRSDGQLLTRGLNQTITSYGYFQYQRIVIDEDENFNPIPIYIDDLDLQPITGEDLPHSQHIGKLVAVDASKAKPATVTRKWHGMTFNISCLVSQAVVDMWMADTLNVGDFVIVSFIDEHPNETERNLAIVVDKVYDSWS